MNTKEIALEIAQVIDNRNIKSGFVRALAIQDCIRKFDIEPLSMIGQALAKDVELILEKMTWGD